MMMINLAIVGGDSAVQISVILVVIGIFFTFSSQGFSRYAESS